MTQHSIFFITIIGALLAYIGIGAIYTKQLMLYVPWLRVNSEQHKCLLVACAITWPAVFIILITWRAVEPLIEPLTRSREADWPAERSCITCPTCSAPLNSTDVKWMINQGRCVAVENSELTGTSRIYMMPCAKCGEFYSFENWFNAEIGTP